MSDENDGMRVDILGLFFGVYNTAEGQAEPEQDLVIKKEDMNRSNGILVARIAWKNETGNRLAPVCKVEIDGKPVQESDGGNVLGPGTAGSVDVPVFRWPGTAYANRYGRHEVKITSGVRKGFTGGPGTFGLTIPKTTMFETKTFTVTLV